MPHKNILISTHVHTYIHMEVCGWAFALWQWKWRKSISFSYLQHEEIIICENSKIWWVLRICHNFSYDFYLCTNKLFAKNFYFVFKKVLLCGGHCGGGSFELLARSEFRLHHFHELSFFSRHSNYNHFETRTRNSTLH